jgi:DNA-binding protein YbaB
LLTVCQVIQAYNRILDLKEKHVDIEVLQILVNVACSLDAQGDIKKKVEQLLTRLTQQVNFVSSSLQIKYQ